MKKLYCVICSKYRKSEKPEISYLLEKALVFSIICSKCRWNKQESIEILKILGLIENMWLLLKYGRRKHKSRI